MKRVVKVIFNRYILILVFFIVWIGFLDRNNFISTLKTSREINRLNKEKEYYNREIAFTKKFLYELEQNPRVLEKFARENYKMKKDGEEIYLVEKEKTNK